jgi:predicted ATPase/DNA-binding SARP family transcriptional activator
VRFAVLGPLAVDAASSPAPLRPSHRRLLSILLLYPDRVRDADELIDQYWPAAPPPTARAALQVHVSELRRRLGPTLIRTARGGYELDLTGHRLDRIEFDALARSALSAAREASWSVAVEQGDRALALWRGAPFDLLVDDEFARPEVHRLEALRAQVVDRLLAGLLALGDPARAAELARAELAEDPIREPLWRHLLLALHLDGRSAEALRAFDEAGRTLAAELGVEPGPALRALEQQIRFDDPDIAGLAAGATTHNLPRPNNRLVGRAGALAALSNLVDLQTPVTIVGAPGVGKTRLAVELGRHRLGRFPDGVWLIRLAAARSRQDVISAVAASTRLRQHVAGLDGLATATAALRALLILDNCEHVIEPCALFMDLVRAADGHVAIVATSRTPVGARDETRFELAPLDVPDAPARGPASHFAPASASGSALELFVDRARTVDPGFRLLPENLPTVAAICRDTGGIPLALELAASWLPAIGVAEIRQVLGGDLGHHAAGSRAAGVDVSLNTAIRRSTSLLTESDRRLLAEMAVFRGPFSLADVHGICAPDSALQEVAAGIARLVEASLLMVERRARGRVVYRLLVPIREHLRSSDASPEDPITIRFTDHYLAKAIAWCPDPLAAGTDLVGFDDDIDNLREALRLGIDRGLAEVAARAIVALNGYFYDRYLAWEGRAWLEKVMELPLTAETMGWVMRAHGSLSHNTNDLESAARSLADALRRFRGLRHADGMVMCLLSIAQVHLTSGRWDAGRRAAQRALTMMGSHGNPSGRAVAANYLGESTLFAGRVREALPALRESARLFRASGQDHRAGYVLSTLTIAAVLGSLRATAQRTSPVAVRLARESGSDSRLVRALGAAAATEAVWGDDMVSRSMLAEATAALGPLDTDAVIELLLPAGFLVRRWRRWEWLQLMLDRAETLAVQEGVAFGLPWDRQISRWRREAAAHVTPGPDQIAASSVMGAHDLAATTMDLLLEGFADWTVRRTRDPGPPTHPSI